MLSVYSGIEPKDARKLNEGGHQSSILTTHRGLGLIHRPAHVCPIGTVEILQVYDTGIRNMLDGNILVVNREYRKLIRHDVGVTVLIPKFSLVTN